MDVRLEVYNQLTKKDASSDAGGLGARAPEQAVIEVRDVLPRSFFVVKGVGGLASGYTIRISPQP